MADVYQSPAGFYIGTWCDCGPYSRESGYFRTLDMARAILHAHPSEHARSTELEEASSDGAREAQE